MNITKKKLKVTCIFHKGCMDGWMSALPVWYAYHQQAEMKFVPAHYSDAPPVVDEEDYVFIVDFSYKPEVIADWFTGEAEVFLIDHHANAIQALVDSPLLQLQESGVPGVYSSGNRKLTARLAFNEGVPQSKQMSGAGLTMAFLMAYESSTKAQHPSRELYQELRSYIRISQSYDLWHHDGLELHENTFLSMFFKNWEKENRAKFDRMLSHPSESHALMMELVSSWSLTSLQQKLDWGKSVTIEHGVKCRALCETAYEVKLPVTFDPQVKVGYIPGDNLGVNVSVLGSIATREFGWDVMVMTAAIDNDKRILTMRSNENGKNVDVCEICTLIGRSAYGLTGGGHRNAAGCTIYNRDLEDVVYKVMKL